MYPAEATKSRNGILRLVPFDPEVNQDSCRNYEYQPDMLRIGPKNAKRQNHPEVQEAACFGDPTDAAAISSSCSRLSLPNTVTTKVTTAIATLTGPSKLQPSGGYSSASFAAVLDRFNVIAFKAEEEDGDDFFVNETGHLVETHEGVEGVRYAVEVLHPERGHAQILVTDDDHGPFNKLTCGIDDNACALHCTVDNKVWSSNYVCYGKDLAWWLINPHGKYSYCKSFTPVAVES